MVYNQSLAIVMPMPSAQIVGKLCLFSPSLGKSQAEKEGRVVTGAELEQATSSGSTSLTSAASDKCGGKFILMVLEYSSMLRTASFADGQIPSSVQQANGAASSSPGSATARPNTGNNDSAASSLAPAFVVVLATTSAMLLGVWRIAA